MQADTKAENTITQTTAVFGVEEMLAQVGNTPLHSLVAKEIEDYGELCDSDCQDCD